VTQLRLRYYQLHYHMSIWMTMIYIRITRQYGFALIRITTLHSFPSRANACCHEKRLHVAVTHFYPIRQSYWSRTSITIHACTTFSIEDGAFSLAFFFTSTRRRAKVLLWTRAHVALPTSRSVSDFLTLFSPQPREVSIDFSSPSRCCCSLGF
jgi:hypothetical protein